MLAKKNIFPTNNSLTKILSPYTFLRERSAAEKPTVHPSRSRLKIRDPISIEADVWQVTSTRVTVLLKTQSWPLQSNLSAMWPRSLPKDSILFHVHAHLHFLCPPVCPDFTSCFLVLGSRTLNDDWKKIRIFVNLTYSIVTEYSWINIFWKRSIIVVTINLGAYCT